MHGEFENSMGKTTMAERVFPNLTMYCNRLCKKKIQLYQREQAERRRDLCMMENYLYDCINEVLQRPYSSDQTLPALNRLKAKIVRLYSRRLQKILDDSNSADRPDGDQPTTYHIFQTKRRRAERTIYCLRDGTGQMYPASSGITQTLTTFLRNIYDTIEVNDASMENLMDPVRCEQHTSYWGMLESPFEPREIYQAIQAGGRAGGERHLGTLD